MTASPDLQAAIRAGCEIGTRCDYPACGGSCPSRVTVTCALHSLATPTPEAIEAAARAALDHYLRETAARPLATFTSTTQQALIDHETPRVAAALSAYWTSILGEKP